MEQTMGKRIMENRKRLGLTQDQLAERLGVTAQAVSKWENDQSCPDITMLPKLAEIFGISTDVLLGHTAVHTAEIVEDGADEADRNSKGGSWELTWNSGRKGGIAFAVLVLLVGVLTLLDKLFSWDVGFWSILWPSTLLVFGLSGLYPKFSFFHLGCSIFGAYFLVTNLHIWEFNIGGELIFPVIIVLFGVSLLVDALRKPRKPRFKVTHNGDTVWSKNGNSKTKSNYTANGESFACSLSFGESTRLVELPRLSYGDVSCSFGELTVDLSACAEIADNCKIDANCSFGELTFLVPEKYRVEPDSSTAFANFAVEGCPDSEPTAVIHMNASVSFGEIAVRYI